MNIRADYKVILENIEPDSTVLDLGCGSGELMEILQKEKFVNAKGIEINEQNVQKCVEKGLSVFHGDIDSGLEEFSDKSFDYVILNQTLQEVKNVEKVLSEALRTGKTVIVGIPNFANYIIRFKLFFLGTAPVSDVLPYKWYETPNIRCLSMKDFIQFCFERGYKIKKQFFLCKGKRINFFYNLFAEIGLFFLWG